MYESGRWAADSQLSAIGAGKSVYLYPAPRVLLRAVREDPRPVSAPLPPAHLSSARAPLHQANIAAAQAGRSTSTARGDLEGRLRRALAEL